LLVFAQGAIIGPAKIPWDLFDDPGRDMQEVTRVERNIDDDGLALLGYSSPPYKITGPDCPGFS
jgi:hypothetical protein